MSFKLRFFVGASVVNALSNWTEVTIQRDGGVYQMKFERGRTVEPLTRIGDSKTTGTKVLILGFGLLCTRVQIFPFVKTSVFSYHILSVNYLFLQAFLT